MNEKLPSGTLTFLFSDIEGSTKLLQQVGDGFGDLLEVHHTLLRRVFVANRGVEVSTEGDAFFVVFQHADDAVRATADAQHALSANEWGVEDGVRVRMGLHTGRGDLIGDNYGGLDVHRAARIASAAHGGQVLVSRATASLIEGNLPNGIALKNLGTHHLKDIEQPEELWQLCIEGLPTQFPAPRTPGSRPNNLPGRLDRFVSRERELGGLMALLPEARLITLTGPGGTGKTRLALEVAYEKLLSYKDGTFVTFLAPVNDPVLVPSALADALGIPEKGLQPIANSIVEFLEDKEMLLVLDNFEQVAEAGPFVGELLAAASRLQVLVTSRVPLRVSGEQEYPVPPMAVPPERDPLPLNLLGEYGSIELFQERARAIKPDFSLTTENAGTITEICRRLDGLPLAIELAAARTRLLSVEDILTRLDEGLGLLSGGARDRPQRQQTLRGAIQWSYDLLDEPTACFFRRLGAFSGGCTYAAADAICNPKGETGTDSLSALETLVDSSLLRSLEGETGDTRFRMLKTIREFAIDSLEGEEADKTRERHGLYFGGLTKELSSLLTAEGDAVLRLQADHENIRAALRWMTESARTGEALEVAALLWRFWQIEGRFSEARSWLTEVLTLPGADVPDDKRVRALLALGSITYWQNDYTSTRRYYEEALELSRALDDRELIAEAAYNTGFLGLIEGDLESARTLYTEALTTFEDLGERKGTANVLWALAMMAVQEGNEAAAGDFGARSKRIYEELQDWYGIMMSEFIETQIARMAGDLHKAEELLLAQYGGSVTAGDATAETSLLDLLADIWIAQGRVEQGLKLAGAIETMRTDLGGGAPLPLLQIDDPREVARASLSEDAIEAAWQEGLAMSSDEVKALVDKGVD